MKINSNFLIDTNILVYSFNKKSEFFEYSRGIIDHNPGKIYIANKSITEFVCVMSKVGLYEIIENELIKISSRFHILYPDSFSTELFNDLILKYKPTGNRVYDFEIVSVMLANRINKLVTINANDFKQVEEIEIISKK
jgi:predicted nucleic acid-binding protein